MAMPSHLLPDRSRRDWTADEIDALPVDGNRYEVVDGELLVTPAPSNLHQRAVTLLAVLLQPYAAAHALDCLVAPTSVRFSATREVHPDVVVLPTNNGRLARDFAEVGRLVLAIEVLSPSTARADRFVKRRLFQSEGVPECWIVDTASRLVERWRPLDEEPEVALETLAWQPESEHFPRLIDLGAFFRQVHGE